MISSFLRQVGRNAEFSKPTLKEFLKLSHQRNDILYEFEEIVDLVTQHLPPDNELLDEIVNNRHRDEFAWYSLDELLIRFEPTTVPYFEDMLNNTETSAQHRILCLRVLEAHAGNRDELIPLVSTQLKSIHPAVREAAIVTLGQMQVEKPKVVEMLIRASKDPRVRVRAKSLKSLSKFGADAKLAIPFIVKLLSDDYLTVQIAAIRCLGELGSIATPAIGELEELTKSDIFLLREEAKLALKRIRE